MIRPRWRKVLRDLWLNRARTVLFVLAVAVGIAGAGAMLTAYAILMREIERNYLATRPASLIVSVDSLTADTLNAVRRHPGVTGAEARCVRSGRLRMERDVWIGIVLFVVEDFDRMEVNTFFHDRGARRPATGEILIERSALTVIRHEPGDTVTVKTPAGSPRPLVIAGTVHDPGQAPAWMEGAAYGYISPATLAYLGEAPVFDEVRVRVEAGDRAAVRRAAQPLRAVLEGTGTIVHRIEVPVPGEHPHQGQMMALLFLLGAFSVLALVLGGVLVAMSVAALMGRELRQIGVMKAVGARTGQIGRLYFGSIGLTGVLALCIGMPVAAWGGRTYAAFAVRMLNFELGSDAVAPWVYLVEIAAGLFVPLLAAAYPVYRGSRLTVREAVDGGAAGTRAFGTRPLDRLLGRVRGPGRLGLLVLRNAVRRPGRLLLTLMTLATGGAMFMVALNVGASWQKTVDTLMAGRRYDLSLSFDRPYPEASLDTAVRGVPGVTGVEASNRYSATLPYPDGTNGDAFAVVAVPAATEMIAYPVVAGRWLQPGDRNALVVNHVLADREPGLAVDREVVVELEGRETTWTVVGVVRHVGGNIAYADRGYVAALAGDGGQANQVQMALDTHDAAAQETALRDIEAALEAAGIGVTGARTVASTRKGLDDHLVILVVLLLIVATLVVAVAGLGLSAAMSLNVLERAREIGVMRAVGAGTRQVFQVVAGEGLLVGVLSWGVALLLAVPLTHLVGNASGMIFLRAPLTIVYTGAGMGLWLGIVLLLAGAACALPAYRAARLPVHRVLAHE